MTGWASDHRLQGRWLVKKATNRSLLRVMKLETRQDLRMRRIRKAWLGEQMGGTVKRENRPPAAAEERLVFREGLHILASFSGTSS